MQQKLTKKLVATSVGLVLLIALIFCIAPIQIAHADSVVWEKVDYEKYLQSDPVDVEGAGIYYGNVKDIPYLRQFKYLYVFAVSAGGMGGYSENGNNGYGGGSGAFCVVKINLSIAESVHFILGPGGGKIEFNSFSEYETGDGSVAGILTSVSGDAPNYSLVVEGMVLEGGKRGTATAPGKGGSYTFTNIKNSVQLIYSQNGVDGGQASHSFSVDLGFRTEHFIYRPTGANPSGKGGGASVYHRGGDGGVMFKNGSDGTMGAGGGGAGKGATQGGYGGDAYMEIYGSNM